MIQTCDLDDELRGNRPKAARPLFLRKPLVGETGDIRAAYGIRHAAGDQAGVIGVRPSEPRSARQEEIRNARPRYGARLRPSATTQPCRVRARSSPYPCIDQRTPRLTFALQGRRPCCTDHTSPPAKCLAVLVRPHVVGVPKKCGRRGRASSGQGLLRPLQGRSIFGRSFRLNLTPSA